MSEKVEWNRLKTGRSKAYRMLPSVLRLPLIGNHREPLLQMIEEGQSILDIGANDRNLKGYLSKNCSKYYEYYSYDIDESNVHDYYSMMDINRNFDLITIYEVIEHLSVSEAYKILEKSLTLLNDHGHIIISTPNVYHPVRFWRDCSHVTPFAYDELVGLLMTVGYQNFTVYRIKSNMRIRDWLVYFFFKPLIQLLGIDYATGIAVVAQKAPSSSRD